MIKIEHCRALIFECDKPVIKEADIYIAGNKISKIDFYEKGTEKVITASNNTGADQKSCEKPARVIDGRRKLAIPALINTHTHAYMSTFRNIADDVSFSTWLFDTVMKIEDNVMTAQDAALGTQLAAIEMLKTGTGTYVDMHMTPHDVAAAAEKSGMRVVLARGLSGSDRNDPGAIRRLNEELADMKEFGGNERISFMLAPHAPYSCGEDYLRFIAEKAHEYKLPVTIHLSEAKNELESFKEKYGMTSIEFVEKTGLFENKTLAAHCVWLERNDFDILRKYNISVAANPASNLKLANGVSPVPKLLENGINVALGTDGAASNNSLNMFKEMALEGLLHKGLSGNPETVSASDCIRMATVNGAAALGMENELGRLEEGYKADIALLSLDEPGLNPYNNLVASLVYSCTGAEVDTMIVNGEVLMEKRELTCIDTEKVYFEAEKIASRYRSYLGK